MVLHVGLTMSDSGALFSMDGGLHLDAGVNLLEGSLLLRHGVPAASSPFLKSLILLFWSRRL